MAKYDNPRRRAAVELISAQIDDLVDESWQKFWGVGIARAHRRHAYVAAATSTATCALLVALSSADLQVVGTVGLLATAVGVIQHLQNVSHRKSQRYRRIEQMLDGNPGYEDVILGGVGLDLDLAFAYKLAGPPENLTPATLRSQLAALGEEGLDLAARAAASGWADQKTVSEAIERVLSVPEHRGWWEQLFAKPGWHEYLVELAVRRVNADSPSRDDEYLTANAYDGFDQMLEAFVRNRFEEKAVHMPLATKVALACGVALNPEWFPEMYSVAHVDQTYANRSLTFRGRRQFRTEVKSLKEAALRGDVVEAAAAETTLAAEQGEKVDPAVADLAASVLTEGDRSPRVAKLLNFRRAS